MHEHPPLSAAFRRAVIACLASVLAGCATPAAIESAYADCFEVCTEAAPSEPGRWIDHQFTHRRVRVSPSLPRRLRVVQAEAAQVLVAGNWTVHWHLADEDARWLADLLATSQRPVFLILDQKMARVFEPDVAWAPAVVREYYLAGWPFRDQEDAARYALAMRTGSGNDLRRPDKTESPIESKPIGR